MSIDILKKLQLKEQNSILILNHPKSFGKIIELFTCKVDSTIKQKYDFVLIFAKDKEEATNLIKKSLDSLKTDGVYWFCYPKKSSKNFKSDITRDVAWDLFKDSSYRAVSQVSIDEDWSALRFREECLVGK